MLQKLEKIISLGNSKFRSYKALEERRTVIIFANDVESRKVKALKNRSRKSSALKKCMNKIMHVGGIHSALRLKKHIHFNYEL